MDEKKFTGIEILLMIFGIILGAIVDIVLKTWLWGTIGAVIFECFIYLIIQIRKIEGRWAWDIKYSEINPRMKELRNLITDNNYTRARDLIDHLIKHLKYEPFSSTKADAIRVCYRQAQKSILAVAIYEPNWWYMPQSSFYLGNHMLISLKHYLREVCSKSSSMSAPNWINPFPFNRAIEYLENGNLENQEFITARFFIYPDSILEGFNHEPNKEEIDFFFAIHKFAQIAPIVINRGLATKWINDEVVKKELEKILKEIKDDEVSKETYNRLNSERLQDFALIDRDIVINVFEEKGEDKCTIYATQNYSNALSGVDMIVSDSIVKYFTILLKHIIEKEKNNKKKYIFQHQRLSKEEVIENMITYYKDNFK